MKCLILSMIIGACLYFSSCNDPASTESTATVTNTTADNAENVRAFIKDVGAKFSAEMKRGDSNALAAHYADDAIVMPPNSEEVKGKDIAGVWGAAIRMGVKDMKLNTTDISGGGDMYAETGTFEMIGPDNKTIDKGKFITVWKKDNEGWKIFWDIWNTSMPMLGSK